MRARAATEIAGYRIESLLGRGGMGEVYLATQDFPKRKVALKLLPTELAEDAAFRERFIRESNAAASLEHPNIVPVYGAGEAGGELYLAMRYVEGTDLRRLLELEGPLELERIVRIVSQIADALDEAHEHHLVHRDVKPGNILVAKGDRTYLNDFGLIRRSEAPTGLTRTGQFMGSVDYVAPEQIQGEAVDGRADVYSLGCVLYECLTGTPPFVRETEVATLYAHLQDPPPQPSAARPELPKVLDHVVAKAMAKRPQDRYPTASALAVETEAALGPAPERTIRGVTRALVAGLVVLAGVALALVLSRDGGAPPPVTAPAALGPDQVVEMDPDAGEVISKASPVSLAWNRPGLPSSSVEFGEGGVWAIDDSGVAHVDPETGEITEIPLSAAGWDVVIAGASVWATDCGFHLTRIDPATDAIRKDILLSSAIGASGLGGTLSLAAGRRSVWVTVSGTGTLVRFDSATNEQLATIGNLGTADDVAFGAGSVWVLDDLGGEVVRIDPERNEVADRIRVPGRLNKITADEKGVWVVSADSGILTRIDPRTLTIHDTYRVGTDPTDVRIALGAVWVANLGDGTLTRIDPVTGVVDTIQVGGAVMAVAGNEATGTLWLQLIEPV